MDSLMRTARQAKNRSYSPYSGFAVGAAVKRNDGTIFSGANIENSSFGLTCCAERVAIFRAVVDEAGVNDSSRLITHLALSCGNEPGLLSDSNLMPCGACLQVLKEFGNDETRVAVDGLGEFRLDSLLPRPFQLDV